MLKKLTVLVSAVLLCEAAGLVGSIFTAQSVDTWYLNLQKPSFNPPSWIFAPVWTLLYALMGVAAALVWFKQSEAARMALIAFGVQLVLNALWSALFFGLRSPGAAFVEIIALWLAIFATLLLSWKVSWVAGVLLLPYLLWVCFAAVLNYSIWRLN
ncbi:MAG: tryptophan-rich sensory protein [Armatimonadota bacterium]|nr:tryptophan-rich sensory protein [Armatimonadota bacterium]